MYVVTNMSGMFYYAIVFNQDISNWDLSQITDISGMYSMFSGLTLERNSKLIHSCRILYQKANKEWPFLDSTELVKLFQPNDNNHLKMLLISGVVIKKKLKKKL